MKVQQKNGHCNANEVKNWIILPHNARCIVSKHLSARANSSMKTEGSGTEQAIGVVVWGQRSQGASRSQKPWLPEDVGQVDGKG